MAGGSSDIRVWLKPAHLDALLAFGEISFGPMEMDNAHDEALEILRAAKRETKGRVSYVEEATELRRRQCGLCGVAKPDPYNACPSCGKLDRAPENGGYA